MIVIPTEHALRTLGRHLGLAAEEALAPLKTTAIEYDIMETIHRYMENPDRERFNAPRIAALTGIQTPSCNNHLGRLQRSGYVRMATDTSRLLTREGTDHLEECRHALRASERYIQNFFEDYGRINLAEAFLNHQRGIE